MTILFSCSTDNAKIVSSTLAGLAAGKNDTQVRCRVRATGIEFYVADPTKGLEG